MPRTPGSKNKKYSSRFKTYEGRKSTDRHIRLTHDMLMHERCLTLSPSAFRLYCYIKLWACGHDTATYSISMSKKYMSAPTFIKAKKELIDKGFIEQPNLFSAKYKKESCEFTLSDKWHSRE